MSNTTRGYSWLDNATFTEKTYPLLEIIMQDPDQKLCWKDREGNFHFHPRGATDFMMQSASLNEDLSVMDHTIHSQPHRGTEFVDTKIRNSWRRRNCVRDMGKLYWVEQYSKKTNRKQMDTYVPVCVADEVQTLEDKYLLLVRPVEELIALDLWGEEARVLYHEYMYVGMGQRVTADQFSRRLSAFMEWMVGFGLGVMEYRHIAIALMREYIPVQYHRNFTANSIGDLITDHISSTAQGIYAGLEGDLPYLTTDAMFKFNDFCARWQCLTGFGKHPPPLPLRLTQSQGHSISSSLAPAPSVESTTPSLPAGDQVLEMLRLLMKKVDGLETLVSSQNAQVSSTLQEFRVQTKEDIREALAECFATQKNKPDVLPGPSYILPPQDNNMNHANLPDRPESPLEYGPTLAESIRDTIRELLNIPDAEIRSDSQLRSIEAALHLRSNLVSVMATGEGKSMIWQVCARKQPQIRTVVVISSAATLQEQLTKAKKMGLEPLHFKWSGTKEHERHFGNSNLVFVAMETAADGRFKG